jgi:hypothetical protein
MIKYYTLHYKEQPKDELSEYYKKREDAIERAVIAIDKIGIWPFIEALKQYGVIIETSIEDDEDDD